MQIKLLQRWIARANDLERECIAVCPVPFEDILSRSECSIILPYGMSALDCAQIYRALCSVSGLTEVEVITKGHHGREVGKLTSDIDIYNFQLCVVYLSAGLATTSMEHRKSGSFVYWDFDETYCFIAGSKIFCETAFPHSPDVLKQYYMDSMANELENEEHWETVYLGLQKLSNDAFAS